MFVFLFVKAYSQPNEFANESFYVAFRKIVTDGQNGFAQYKGAKQPNELAGLIDIYKVKIILPGADSGEIVFPIIGAPYAEYYFKPGKTKALADQRIANLKTATEMAISKSLYEKKEEAAIKDFVDYKTYYFTSANTGLTILADFESGIYEEKGVYKINFKINGRTAKTEEEKKSALSQEIDLDGKLEAFLNDSPSYFSSLKGNMKSSDQYGQTYETKMSLFGLKGEIEDRKLECDLNYSIGFTEFKDLDEANKIFAQLKSGLITALGSRINFGNEEQSQYNDKSFSVQGLDAGYSFLQSKNRITLTINREKDYPAVYLTFNRKKY